MRRRPRPLIFATVATLLLVPFVDARAPSHNTASLRAVRNVRLSGIQASAALSAPSDAGSYLLREADATDGGTWSVRLCNAYAYAGWVHVFHSFGRRPGMSYTKSGGDGEQSLTKASGPLPYKRCIDVEGVELSVGSLLKFRIGGDMHIGSFSVDQLPMHGSLLQVVLKRRDTWSTAADFSSHIFAQTAGPQVALVNAYLGKSRSILEVRTIPTDLFEGGQPGPDEEVNFGTVVDLVAGSYEWRLMSMNGPRLHAEKASVEFKAWDRTPYTVLRVGTEAIGGQSYKEELIVWPAEGATIRGSSDGDAPDKGLFGIPKTLDQRKRHQRSGAARKMVSAVMLATIGAFAAAL